ncbi:MAG TPA: aldo/keto reductase [Bacteroides sp.]|nr:aldo/keto reductase [Bacteroides sp.]
MKPKRNFNRRQFLGTSMAATAGIAMVSKPANAKASTTPDQPEGKHPFNPKTFGAMPTNALGKTGYKVGILSLGGQATIETEGRENLSEKIINRALDLGVNYIDTAASYGRGLSQKNIGRVMKTRRNETWLSTKSHRRSYDESMQLLEESLTNLQTDHLDTWQLHNVKTQEDVDQIFADDGAIKAFEKAKSEGMVRCLGITGHYEPIVLKQCMDRFDFDTILMAVNGADVHYLSFKNYLLPEAQKKGIGIISMKVATRGRMLSTWTPPPIDEQPSRLATTKPGALTIKEALQYNMTLPVSTTIIGVDDVAQIEENVKIASEFSPLSEDEMAAIEYKCLPIVRQGLYFRRWELGV